MSLPSSPTIHLKNASLVYQKNPLFQNFSLTIPANTCVCLLGQSGVGKSSLLRMIAGLTTGAEKLSFNIETSDNEALDDRIAYMAQTDGLLPWLTVLENVLIGYRLRGQMNKSIYDKAADLLSKVGLTEFIRAYPAVLSGGMRQRVALARTLLENRPIILMDEPFSSLDAITRLRLQNLSVQLFKGKTVLLVTHDPLEALRLGDIIYVLSGSPVSLSESISLPYGHPRDPTKPELLNLQSILLRQLIA